MRSVETLLLENARSEALSLASRMNYGIKRSKAKIVSVVGKSNPKAVQKDCYGNAWRYVTSNRGSSYVLGIYFLYGKIPIEHAWVEENGHHVDVTLRPNDGDIYVALVALDRSEIVEAGARLGFAPTLYDVMRKERGDNG